MCVCVCVCVCVYVQVGPVGASEHDHVEGSCRWPRLRQHGEDSRCLGTGKVNRNNGGAPPIDSPQQRVSRARQGIHILKSTPYTGFVREVY